MGVDRVGWPGDRTRIEMDMLRRGLWAGHRDFGASYDSFSVSIDAETPEYLVPILSCWAQITYQRGAVYSAATFPLILFNQCMVFCYTPALDAYRRTWEMWFTIDTAIACINSVSCMMPRIRNAIRFQNGKR